MGAFVLRQGETKQWNQLKIEWLTLDALLSWDEELLFLNNKLFCSSNTYDTC